MAWSHTVYDRVFTNADFDGQAYVDGLPLLLEKFVQHAGNYYVGSSTTSVVLGTGSKSFTVETSKPYQVGTPLRIASTASPSTNFMEGVVTAYDAGTGALVVDVVSAVGSGTFALWSVNIGGGTVAGGSPVSIAQGGTGATTAANARTNLGLAASPTFTGTTTVAALTASGNVTLSAAVLIGNGTLFPYKLQVNNNTGSVASTGTTTTAVFVGADGSSPAVANVAYGGVPSWLSLRYDGTFASSTALVTNDVIGSFTCGGWNGSAIHYGSAVRAAATENWVSGTNGGTRVFIETTPNGSVTRGERWTIQHDGSMTVGYSMGTPSLIVSSGATFVNGLQIIAAATGGPVQINTIGSDTNVNAILSAKGTGTWRFSNTSTSTSAADPTPVLAVRNLDTTVNNTSSVVFRNATGNVAVAQINAINEHHTSPTGSLNFYTGNASALAFAMKIDSTQRVLVGHTAAISTGISAGMQLTGIGDDAFLSISRYSADVNNGGIIVYKSRGASKGTQAVVVNGDGLGEVDFAGYDGTSAVISSYIQCVASATVSTGIIPSTINFKTMTAAGTISIGLAISHTQGVSVPNGTFTPHQTFGIVGTNAVNNAQAGSVGERITNSASVSVATYTPTTVTSISLTAGDWEIFGNFYWTTPNSTVISLQYGSVSGTTNNVAVGVSGGFNAVVGAAFTGDGSSISGLVLPPLRVNISSASTRYLTFYHNGSTAITITGNIRAIRVR